MVGYSVNKDFKVPKEVIQLAERLKMLTDQNIAFIKPEVDYVLRNRITDEKQIKRLLDRLLDCAGMSDDGLALFKRLCRYFYYINPQVTAEYVYSYRDLYDSEPKDNDDSISVSEQQI